MRARFARASRQTPIEADAENNHADDVQNRVNQQRLQGALDLHRELIDDHGELIRIMLMEKLRRAVEETAEKVFADVVTDFAGQSGSDIALAEGGGDKHNCEPNPKSVGCNQAAMRDSS